MVSEKFKSKSIEFCNSAMNFAKELEKAGSIIEDLSKEEVIKDKDMRSSKLRKLKECFCNIGNYAVDASTEAIELDDLAEEPKIKRKTKFQKKAFGDVKKKIAEFAQELEATTAIATSEDVKDSEEVNFSEVVSTKIKSLIQSFAEVKEMAEDAGDATIEVSESVKEDKEEKAEEACPECGKTPCECKKDNKIEFSEMKSKTAEVVDEISKRITDNEQLKDFAKELEEIKSLPEETEEDLQIKVAKINEFCDKAMNFNSTKEEGKMEKEKLTNEEIAKYSDEIDDKVETYKKFSAEFSKKAEEIQKMAPETEEELDEKLTAAEELKEEIANFSTKKDDEEALAINEEKVQELSTKVDEMEEIISSMEAPEKKEELKASFSEFEKRLGEFCDAPSAETKEKLEESAEEIKEISKKAKSFSEKRFFSKLNKCFSAVMETISESNLPPAQIPEEAPVTINGEKVEELDKAINEKAEELIKKAEEIKDDQIKNFSIKKLSLIKKIICFSEEDIDKKLTEVEETAGEIKEELKAQAEPETEEKKEETKETEEKSETKEETETKEFSEEKPAEEAKEETEEETEESEKKEEKSEVTDEEAANFSEKTSREPAFVSLYKNLK